MLPGDHRRFIVIDLFRTQNVCRPGSSPVQPGIEIWQILPSRKSGLCRKIGSHDWGVNQGSKEVSALDFQRNG